MERHVMRSTVSSNTGPTKIHCLRKNAEFADIVRKAPFIYPKSSVLNSW